MGEDLCLTWVELPESPKGADSYDTVFWKQHFDEYFTKLEDDTLLGAYEEQYGDTPHSELDNPDDLPIRSEKRILANVVRVKAKELMNDFLENDYRDAQICRVGKQWTLITGGMSWGDDPTDSFSDVAFLAYLTYEE